MDLRVSLDEGSEDLCMLPEITQESITTPTAHDLHGLDRDTLEQVEEGGTYMDAMTLEGLQTRLPSSRGQPLDERRLGERARLALVLICKQVTLR